MTRRSPLHDATSAIGARFVEFGGWEMPLQFGGTLSEHKAVREAVGVFDVSHLGRFQIAGPAAIATVDALLCNDLKRIRPGRAQYTMMLTEEGGVVDDIIVWWVDDSRLVILPNGVNHDRVRDAFAGRDVDITDLRPTSVLLAIQGPGSPDVIDSTFGVAPGRFHVVDAGDALLAGTGYTGEPGCEAIVPLDTAEKVFDSLLDAGAVPSGLGARDTLRLEMGYPLWGQDLDTTTSPLEAGLGWVVGWDHEFVGREALLTQRAAGIERSLVGFAMPDRRIPRPGCRLESGDSIGTVTSGNFSPTLEVGIGMGYLGPPPAEGEPVSVEIRDEWFEASQVDPPFVKT